MKRKLDAQRSERYPMPTCTSLLLGMLSNPTSRGIHGILLPAPTHIGSDKIATNVEGGYCACLFFFGLLAVTRHVRGNRTNNGWHFPGALVRLGQSSAQLRSKKQDAFFRKTPQLFFCSRRQAGHEAHGTTIRVSSSACTQRGGFWLGGIAHHHKKHRHGYTHAPKAGDKDTEHGVHSARSLGSSSTRTLGKRALIWSLKAKLNAWVGKYRMTLVVFPLQKAASPCSWCTRVKQLFSFFWCVRGRTQRKQNEPNVSTAGQGQEEFRKVCLCARSARTAAAPWTTVEGHNGNGTQRSEQPRALPSPSLCASMTSASVHTKTTKFHFHALRTQEPDVFFAHTEMFYAGCGCMHPPKASTPPSER